MKILFVNTFYYPDVKGGAEVSVKKLAEELIKNNNEVYVLCTGIEKKEVINGVNIYRVNLREESKSKVKKLSNRLKYIKDTSKKELLTNVIKEINPDVIHTNNLFVFSTIIWDIANELNIQIVHTLRDYALMCPKNTLIKNNSVCLKSRSVCKIYRGLIRNNTEKVNFVTAPSNFTLNKFKEANFFNGVESKCVYNAIDKYTENINELKKIKEERIKDNKFKFCFLGTLHEFKGIRVLVESFKRLNSENVELHIAGDGDLKEYIITEAEKDNRIKFYGRLSEDKVNNLIINCDVMVVPSMWYEPFGRVVIDAYKFGLPVVAFDIGGLKEIVNEKTGYLVEVGNSNQLYEVMNKIQDKKMIYNMLDDILEELDKYSIKKQVYDFEQIYNKLLKNK